MISRKVMIEIPTGLEARPIAQLVQVASQYGSSIYLENAAKKVNAKSIMGMMTLGLIRGEEVLITAEGADEEAALNGIAECLAAK